MDLNANEKKKHEYLNPADYFSTLSNHREDIELIKRYRFNRNGINYLCDLLGEDLNGDKRGCPIPVETQVYTYFFKLITINI